MPSNETAAPIKDFKPPQVSVVFMGTPEFAQTALAALFEHTYHVVGVVTQPDRKVGRKQELTAPPVKRLAIEHAVPVFQPEKLDAEAVKTILDWKPDVIIVAAYGKLLPENLLAAPGFGCLNIHASLLPRWRGASPVANALMAGDTETGITLIQLDEGMDTGDILAVERTPIGPDECAPQLLERLAVIGARLLTETLPLWITRSITATPQPLDGNTLCQLIDREDGHVFWNESAESIYNRYRGLHPWPGLFTHWNRTPEEGPVRVKLQTLTIQKSPLAIVHPVGTVLEIGEKIGIVTGSGVVFPLTLQLEGKETVAIADFITGYPDFIGSVLV
ncbi:MAG: methionyl-tRNA formyltransferase [Candidatus Moraniibacteriota bacterium]